MSPPLIQRMEALASQIEQHSRRLQAISKADRYFSSGMWSFLAAAIGLQLMKARPGVVAGVALVGVVASLGSALFGRQAKSVQRRIESCREELGRLIAAVEASNTSSRTPLTIGFANLSGPDMDDIASKDAQIHRSDVHARRSH